MGRTGFEVGDGCERSVSTMMAEAGGDIEGLLDGRA
jgi:hypothetical protein